MKLRNTPLLQNWMIPVPQSKEAFFSRSVDHLGVIGANLRDLVGFATLAHELIQNGDDAEATWMAFRITDQALLVDNDGVFSDCGQPQDAECSWREDPKRAHRCDFHRFRLIAAADKREQEGTVGAFGVGFLAVYQITDHPELISVGRHWMVDETSPEDKRIRQCPGCSACRSASLPGTRFVLPWALDGQSNIRKRLRAQPVERVDLLDLEEEVSRALPEAMLFLQHLERIEVWHGTKLVKRVERALSKNLLRLTDGATEICWCLLPGAFEEDASAIRVHHRDRIEEKRSAEVTVAVPYDLSARGSLYAYLPTQQTTGLPFHVQADFFPTTDRKHVILDRGFQADWNLAALAAAARAVSASVEVLRETLGPQGFWRLAQAIHQVGSEVLRGERDKYLAAFWEALHPVLRVSPVVWSSTEDWLRPEEVLLLERPEEEAAQLVLEGLGLRLVHPALRPFFGLLRANEIGVQLLDVRHVTAAVTATAPGTLVPAGEWPAPFAEADAIPLLWREMDLLLKRPRKADEESRVRSLLRNCPIVPCRDGTLRPASEACCADEDTVASFSQIAPDVPFAAPLGDEGAVLERLCRRFDVETALDYLEAAAEAEGAQWDDNVPWVAILGWFEGRKDQVLSKESLIRRLSELPLFPSAVGLRPLSDLGLPGDFVDPLGLASLVDLTQLDDRRDFLRDLGARELTIIEYATTHVPRAFKEPLTPLGKRRKAVEVLAQRLGELRDDSNALNALAEAPLVECSDGEFRSAERAYLPSGTTQALLGDSVHYARLPDEHHLAIEEFLLWLGVADEPRDDDLLSRIDRITSETPNDDAIQTIAEVAQYLAERWRNGTLSARILSELRDREWLPATKDAGAWFRPSDLYASFRDYLFATQALFLALPVAVQRTASEFLQALGLGTEPPPKLVVAHLLACVKSTESVNPQVYRELDKYVQEPAHHAVLGRLRNQPCLLLAEHGYETPSNAFWGTHPFGKWRYTLGQELRVLQPLLDFLGVKESAGVADALAVLEEIEGVYSPGNRVLPQPDQAVVLACWRLLAVGLENQEIEELELQRFREHKVVVGPRGNLDKPAWMFFEDRAGFAARFPRLRNNLIAKPEGAWRAMAAAGVRSLANAATSELLECVDPVPDQDLIARIRERRDALSRVLETAVPGGAHGVELNEFLAELQCVRVNSLVVRFRIRAFVREEASEPERPLAHYQREERALYAQDSPTHDIWPGVARELAVGIDREGEAVGSIAAGFREVLAADSPNAAETALDELGFPRIVISSLQPSEGAVVTELGALDVVIDAGSGVEPDVGDSAGAPAAAAGPDQPSTGTRTRQSQRGKPQGKLRTYVVSGERKESGPSDQEAAEQRSDVDQAGIALVLASERAEGRRPLEMPHANPGYDIESRDESGDIVRYIEVKSSGAAWGERGVGLTAPQFDCARALGDQYWLYVVECALDESAAMYRIRDPARQVMQYLYDDGWRSLAE